MGGIDPISASLMAAGTLAAQHQQAKSAARAAGEQQNLQYQMLWKQQEQKTKQQRDLLKRQLASSRAALAGGGIGFAGGSGQALMQGMTQRVEEDIANGYDMAGLQHQARFAGAPKPSGIESLMQGIDKAKQVYQVFRPLVG